MSKIYAERDRDKILNTLFAYMADGKSLRKSAKLLGNSPQTLLNWIDATPERQERYARAFITRADYLVEEMLDIADQAENDTYIDENGFERTDHDVIARARLRVDTRKWFASKLSPKKYGDKVEQLIKADINLKTITELSDEDLANIAVQHAVK